MNKETLLSVARQAVKAVPEVVQYLSEATKAELLGYPPIRANYWAEIYDSVEQYLTGDKPVTRFRNKASQAVSESFTDAVYEGYAQAGAELPLPDDIQAWLSQRIAEERTHIEGMFDRLKAEWEGLDWIKEAYARADSYSRTLDAMYSEAQLRGMKNQMVTWVLGDTEEHCTTCATLAGKKHRISYLIANNYIPRKPDAGMDCHGYRCDCKIVDKNGKEVTIGETKAMKGGEGSGNFGHAGRPGEVGGSAAGGGGSALGKVQDIYRGDLSGVSIQYGVNERGAGGFVGERESIFVNPSQSFMTAEEEKDGIRSRIQRYKDKLDNTDLSDEERRNFTDKLNEYKDKLDNYIPYTLPESENEIVIHELGHVIYAQVEMGEIDGVTDLLPPSKNPTPYSETMMNNFVSMRDAYPVSEYGNKNFDEYFSESFVLYVREDYNKIHPDLLDLFRRISK